MASILDPISSHTNRAARFWQHQVEIQEVVRQTGEDLQADPTKDA